MIYTLLNIAILLAIVAGGLVVFRSFNGRHRKLAGFRDWVRNPDFKKAAEECLAARESLDVSDDIADAEILQMVDRLFVQEDEDFNLDRLRLVGIRAAPFLIEALENPRTATARFRNTDFGFTARSPFERICHLLALTAPPEAVRTVARYIDHKDDHFRKQAALTLGNIGTSECAEPMLKALADEQDFVRSYAMMGIEQGMEASRCTKDFLDTMFPALVRLLNRHDGSVSGRAPALLLAIDAVRALPILLSPEYFTVENRELNYIVRALNAAGQKIPHDKLLPLLKAIEPFADEYPHDYEYADALIAYAYNSDASAQPDVPCCIRVSQWENTRGCRRGVGDSYWCDERS